MAVDGLDQAPAGAVRVGRDGLIGLVAERRELVVITNAATHQSYGSSPEPGQESHGSFLGMPLIHYRAVLGVLVAWKRVHREFGNEEVILFLNPNPPEFGRWLRDREKWRQQ